MSLDNNVKLEPQWERKEFDELKDILWTDPGVRNAWTIQAVNYCETMFCLPRILNYFTCKIWYFPFKHCTDLALEIQSFMKSEAQCRKTIDEAIEENTSIYEALASSDGEADQDQDDVWVNIFESWRSFTYKLWNSMSLNSRFHRSRTLVKVLLQELKLQIFSHLLIN